PLAGDVGNHFTLVGQTNLGHLTESGVRLLGGRGVNTGAYAALLRVSFHGRNLVPLWLAGAWLADQLINGGHCALSIGPKLYGQHKQTKVALTRPLSGSAAPQLQRTTHLLRGGSHAHNDLLRLVT